MLVLFTGITSFQSIHEWLHHHQDETEHHEESCDWFSVKALPFQKSEATTIELLLFNTFSEHIEIYLGSNSIASFYYSADRGPPAAGLSKI
jgi:hypothetical protein